MIGVSVTALIVPDLLPGRDIMRLILPETGAVFFRRGRGEGKLRSPLDRVEKPRLPMPPDEDTQAWYDWILLPVEDCVVGVRGRHEREQHGDVGRNP